MKNYSNVVDNLGNLPDFIDYHRAELEQIRKEIPISGNVQNNLARLPGITDRAFSLLQEIEAVLNYLNIQLRSIRRKYFQKYLEGYNRALTSRDAEKYVDGENEVIEFEILINECALLRNQFLSIMKGLESKNYMLSNLVRLRCAGQDDFVL